MKRLLYVFTSLIALSVMTGCDNEIDINAPWRETPVVYAFLDPNTPVQYLRIEKTYQNSVNLTTEQGAKINDSLYFDTIVVKVKSTNQSVTFTKTTEIPKETGYFSNQTHYLYKGTLTPVAGKNYTLEIFSPKTGNTYLSTTTAISTSDITAANFNFTYDYSMVNVTVKPISGASDVDATIRFKYLEYTTSIADADTFSIDYLLSDQYSESGVNYRYSVVNSVLVNYIKGFIAVKPGYTRKIIGFDLYYIGGGKEMTDMFAILKPSEMVVQKKLEYSNISGGLGIFSSRSVNFDGNIQTIDGNWSTDQPKLIDLLNGHHYLNDGKDLNFIP